MKLTIQTDDKIVYCNGVAIRLPELDWAARCFLGDPGSPHDDVAAVQFDTGDGQGHIEFKTVKTKQVLRPNFRPPDCPLTQQDFDTLFGWVVDAWRLRKAEMELEEAKAEAESVARAEMEQSFEPSQASPVQSANSEDVEALKAQLAAQKAENSAMQKSLDEIKGDLASLYAANKKIVEGGA